MEIKLLSCPLCMKPHFDGVDSLRSSLITVATSPISCPVCNELLMGLDKLTIHLFSHITNQILLDNFPKSIDQVQSTESKKSVIEVKESQKKRPCEKDIATPVQEITTCKESEFKVTEVDRNGEKKNCFRCDICNFCFSDENILEMHQKLLHQTQADKKTGLYSYHCHLCSKKFKMRGSLMVHLRVAHYGYGNANRHTNCLNFEKNDDNEASLECNMEQSKTTKNPDNKQWACDVCSKLFTTKYFLKKHKRLHTGEMPYFCSQCNKSFTFQQSYHKHMLYHSSEKPHVCGECGRAFKELSTLHNHERIHSGERPFACETCGKCFRQRVSYLVHRRIHTGAMPYKCTACDKNFRYKVSQKSHKCTANPPGIVIRTPDLVEKLIQKTTNRFADNSRSNVEIRGNPNTMLDDSKVLDNPNPNSSDTSNQNVAVYSPSENLVNLYNNLGTIIFNCDGQIVGQNFSYDGQNLLINDSSPGTVSSEITNENFKNKKLMQSNGSENDQNKIFLNDNQDFFSMVLSPVLPDVQSLCLSNSSSVPDGDESSLKQSLKTINEESFKRLLYDSNE